MAGSVSNSRARILAVFIAWILQSVTGLEFFTARINTRS